MTTSHLKALWPGPCLTGLHWRDDYSRVFRAVIEDELLWRCQRKLPDAAALQLPQHQHAHAKNFERSGGCTACGSLLGKLQTEVARNNRLAGHVMDALANGDCNAVCDVLPHLVSELVAGGSTSRYLHHTARTFLLHGGPTDQDFMQRAHTFLQAEETVPDEPKSRRLGWVLAYSSSQLPVNLPSASINCVYVDKIGTGELAIVLNDVRDTMRAEEQAAEKIRSESETWLGYLRLAAPRREMRVSGDIHLLSDSHPVPGHRGFWSSRDARRGLTDFINARMKYSAEDQVRIDAAVGWVGLALDVWPESPVRAVGLIWMGIEALFKNPLSGRAVWPYLNRLSIELSYELVRHHQARRAIIRKHGDPDGKELWVGQLIDVKDRDSVREWLDNLVAKVSATPIPVEEALLLRARQTLNLFRSQRRHEVYPQILRDLRLLYAVRNGMAHSGRFEMTISLAHYLFSLGLEILKAAICEVISRCKDTETSDNLRLEDVWDTCRKFALDRT